MLNFAILLLPLFFHSSSVLCQESLQILTLHRGDSSITVPVRTIGVSVDEEKLNEVSNSILMAENWLRAHVLAYYPSSKIHSVIVANDRLCNGGNVRNREEIVGLIVDSMKNLHHSLIRWGLEKEIKVSVSISFDCLKKFHLRPVFRLLEKMNSTYTVNPTRFSDEIVGLLGSELKSMNDLGVFRSEAVDVISPVFKQVKSTTRKLSFIDSLWSAETPSPVVKISPTPEIQPPIMGPASGPSHPYGFSLPPCNPYTHGPHAAPPLFGVGRGPSAVPPTVNVGRGTAAASPLVGNNGGSVAGPPVVSVGGATAVPPNPSIIGNVGRPLAGPPSSSGEERLWCVAKPSVPSEKLQVALDYACGAGGADCGPIRPNGSCFSPDSVVAHASYAFNSYWQKNKKNGGVCGFEGTAMLISTDPSFLHCHFILG